MGLNNTREAGVCFVFVSMSLCENRTVAFSSGSNQAVTLQRILLYFRMFTATVSLYGWKRRVSIEAFGLLCIYWLQEVIYWIIMIFAINLILNAQKIIISKKLE